MKYITICLAMFLLWNNAQGQQEEYTFSPPSGKLILSELNEVRITGDDVNEVKIITDLHKSREEDERSKGMRILSPNGMQDNTGIGLYMEKNDNNIHLTQISPNFDHNYIIIVPKSINIFYEHSSHHGDDLLLENLSGEIEASVHHNDVVMRKISGPCAINSLHGSIDANFSSLTATGSIFLHARHDDVDVTVPSSAKADFKLYSSHGTVYTDLDLELENNTANSSRSSTRIIGKLNGGGTKIHLESTHDNLYLRKS